MAGSSTGERSEVGAQIEVEIERILPGGLGLAHSADGTVLVSLAAPGDRVLVEIERQRDRVLWGRIVEVLKPGPTRVEPACPYFGRCGGCDFQQLSYQAQLDAKAEIVRDCLKRIARIEPPSEIPITASPAEWHYRSRAMWQRDREQNLLGYYERGSRNVVDVAYCPILSLPMQDALGDLRLAMDRGDVPEDARDFQAVMGDDGPSITPPPHGKETSETRRTIEGITYRFSSGGFFQINQELLPSLVHAAIDPLEGHNALDLYCGVGLFTLPLAKRFRHVIGIESNDVAIRHARKNARDANLRNTEFHADTVTGWLRRHIDRLKNVDAVLLDPPRVGAEKATLQSITKLRPRHISYVSCDPATLARDLKALLHAGYTLTTIEGFDMFPQTHHVETVAHLSL
jgi:23S rRNA (uracil1939-C5)-methyltransferase